MERELKFKAWDVKLNKMFNMLAGMVGQPPSGRHCIVL